MNTKENLHCKFCHFYSSEKPGNLVTVFILIQGFTGFLYSQNITSIINRDWLLNIVFFSWFMALLFTLPRVALFLKGYKAIRLFQHLHTGILTDLRFRVNQVAIRVDTLSIILDDFSHKSSIDDVYKCGEDVGKDFMRKFKAEMNAIGADFCSLSTDEQIYEWLEYDSTVGFGRFRLKEIEPHERALVCKIEFKPVPVNAQKAFLTFFAGYLAGACYEIYGEQADMIATTSDGKIFEISQAKLG